MARSLTSEQREDLLERMAAQLDQRAVQQQTLTYLELADAVAMPGPQRIHRVTRLLEILMKRDAAVGRAPRSALVVSRTGTALPAPGFFDYARRLGLFEGGDAAAFHQRLLDVLFAGSDHDAKATNQADPSPGAEA